ncbi:MAG: chemotaxis protein CheA [Geobacter sp.]|uniref:chemotaxis protein CheA n=1 Tax=Trichlorobacter sp. TaxID=2911007 RepID=UPI002A36DBED|nr:chemotaxis protein CheA [Trichlorobacter sp.]MDY0384440.1 chemotaxis protein CheA [Trichlorobacter sp.]
MSVVQPPITDAARDFLAEAEEILEELGAQLADLADMAESGSWDPDLLNAIFRGAHSLKGVAGMFGFTAVAEVAHNTENLLDWLRMGKVSLSPTVVDLLFRSARLLTVLLRATSDGTLDQHQDEIDAHAAAITASLSPGSAPTASSLEQLGLPAAITGSLTEYEEHRLRENLAQGRCLFVLHTSFDLGSFDLELGSLTDLLKKYGEVVSTLPSIGENNQTNIDFDLLLGTQHSEQELRQLLEGRVVSLTGYGAPAEFSAPVAAPVTQAGVAMPVTDAVVAVDEQPGSVGAPAASTPVDENATAKSMSRTVRVDIGKLDSLMNIVGELVLAQSSITAIANRMRAEGFSRMAVDLGKAAKGLERRLADLQSGVMDIRMIPVGQLYDKMSRIVRSITREQGKKVDLKLYGADTELDKLIVEDIADPLMHIIRNAIDHGIESPEQRRAQGKEERGTVRLSSYQKGNHVVIEVEDDGGGIDIEKIKQKALAKGLVHDVSSLSDREALELIFLPGFSTADQITDVSGRGVGMDVVRNNIAAVSGMVDIETSLGKGSRFTIVLPITLAIIKALIITCAGRTYALPITSVVESLLLVPEEIRTVENKEVITLRETTLPLLRLDRFLAVNRIDTPIEQYVVVVGAAEKRLGLVVDDLLGQQDIVIKPLGEVFRSIRGISGAADLGDQRTILVLDAGGIITEMVRSGG